jgi:putative transposase
MSVPAKYHKKYPHLLRGRLYGFRTKSGLRTSRISSSLAASCISRAIIDLYSRKILTWRISNTLDAEFCVAALEEAIALYGIPAIFNTDQGCQFTSDAFIAVLEGHHIEISMDGVNRALDNIFIERFWRSLKYEDIYLNDYRTMIELKAGVKRYMEFYNGERFHASHDYQTPNEVYESKFQRTEKEIRSVA